MVEPMDKLTEQFAADTNRALDVFLEKRKPVADVWLNDQISEAEYKQQTAQIWANYKARVEELRIMYDRAWWRRNELT